jgi:hypothetical protein
VDLAIWRRILLWPFEVTIPEADRVPGYERALMAEGSGILTWLISGLRRYQEAGRLAVPAPPEPAAAATLRAEHPAFVERAPELLLVPFTRAQLTAVAASLAAAAAALRPDVERLRAEAAAADAAQAQDDATIALTPPVPRPCLDDTVGMRPARAGGRRFLGWLSARLAAFGRGR